MDEKKGMSVSQRAEVKGAISSLNVPCEVATLPWHHKPGDRSVSAHCFFSFLSRCWCFPRGQRLTAVLSSNSSPVSVTYTCESRRWHHASFPAVWTNDAGMTCVSGKGGATHCAAAFWLTAPLFLLSVSICVIRCLPRWSSCPTCAAALP